MSTRSRSTKHTSICPLAVLHGDCDPHCSRSIHVSKSQVITRILATMFSTASLLAENASGEKLGKTPIAKPISLAYVLQHSHGALRGGKPSLAPLALLDP